MADKTDPVVSQQPGDGRCKTYQATEETSKRNNKFVEDRKSIFESQNKTPVTQRKSKDRAPVNEQDNINRYDKNNVEGNISDNNTSANVHGELHTGNDPKNYLESRDSVNMHSGHRIRGQSKSQSGDDGKEFHNNLEEEELNTRRSGDKTVHLQQDGENDGSGSGKSSDIEVLENDSEEERRWDQEYVFPSIPSQADRESNNSDKKKSSCSKGITTQNNCTDCVTKTNQQMGKSESIEQKGPASFSYNKMSLDDGGDDDDNDDDGLNDNDDAGVGSGRRKDLLEKSSKKLTKPVPQARISLAEKPIRFVLELTDSEILEGKDVTLKCQLSKSTPVTWTKDGAPLEESEHAVLQKEDTSHQLRIRKVKMEDAGTYAVQIGEISSSCTLTVKEKPIGCQLSKSAPVTWTKDGAPLEESEHAVLQTEDTSHQLRIRKVRMEDAGTYAVQIGEISSSCTLTVKVKSQVISHCKRLTKKVMATSTEIKASFSEQFPKVKVGENFDMEPLLLIGPEEDVKKGYAWIEHEITCFQICFSDIFNIEYVENPREYLESYFQSLNDRSLVWDICPEEKSVALFSPNVKNAQTILQKVKSIVKLSKIDGNHKNAQLVDRENNSGVSFSPETDTEKTIKINESTQDSRNNGCRVIKSMNDIKDAHVSETDEDGQLIAVCFKADKYPFSSFDEKMHCLERDFSVSCKKIVQYHLPLSNGQAVDSIGWSFYKNHLVFLSDLAIGCQEDNACIVFREESHTTKISSQLKVVCIPEWKEGERNEKENLRTAFRSCLDECFRKMNSVDIIIQHLDTWKMRIFVKQLIFVVKEMSEHTKDSKSFHFRCGNEFKLIKKVFVQEATCSDENAKIIWESSGRMPNDKETATCSMKFGKVSLYALQKEVTEIFEENNVVCFWNSTSFNMVPNDNRTYQALDEEHKQQWVQSRQNNHDNQIFTTVGRNKKEIVHAICKPKREDIKHAIDMGISTAMSARRNSLLFYFADSGNLSKSFKQLIELVIECVSSSAPGLEDEMKIGLVVESIRYPVVAECFTNKQVTPHCVLAIKVVGTKEHVAQTCKELIDSFGQVQQCHSITQHANQTEPENQSMDRCFGSPDDKKEICETGKPTELDTYVKILGIPNDYSSEKLKLELFKKGFPIKPPALVHINGRNSGILICETVKDARKLAQFRRDPFTFKLMNNEPLTSIKGSFSKIVWTSADSTLRKKIVDELCEIGVQVDQTTLQMTTFSTYQIEKTKLVEKEYFKEHSGAGKQQKEDPVKRCALSGKQKAGDFEKSSVLLGKQKIADLEKKRALPGKQKTGDSEKPRDLPEKQTSGDLENSYVVYAKPIKIPLTSESVFIWLKSKYVDDFMEIEKVGGYIVYEDENVIINVPENEKENLKTITDKISQNMGSVEVFKTNIDPNHVNIIREWCNALKKQGKLCEVDPKTSEFWVLGETYEELVSLKHQYKVKTDQVRTTRRNLAPETLNCQQENLVNSATESMRQKKERSRNRPSNLSDDEIFQKSFSTDENIRVLVYKADILNLKVDCIVNAANERLEHGGGVALAIARAAGPDLTEAGNKYIKNKGRLLVGQVHATTAGSLNYKCVIHVVGPKWSDYYPHDPSRVQKCEENLYKAIYNCYCEAEKKKLRSIALPAVSSAIYGVPLEICVRQYANATSDYSRKTTSLPGTLREIHFVDIRKDIVERIQQEFQTCFRMENLSSTAQCSEANKGENSKVENESSVSNQQYKMPDPLFYECGPKRNVLQFVNELKICVGDLFHEKASAPSAIIVTSNETGNGGTLKNTLEAKIDAVYIQCYKKQFAGKLISNNKLGSMFILDGYSCGFTFIINIVYPLKAQSKDIGEREEDLANIFSKMLQMVERHNKIRSVVTGQFGINSRSKEDLQMWSRAILKSFISYCKQKHATAVETVSPLEVKIVCQTEEAYSVLFDVINEYAIAVKTPMLLDTAEQQKNISEDVLEEDTVCVICQDRIENPTILPCSHSFCTECIEQQFKYNKKCPSCGKVCGVITGDQPDGRMTYKHDRWRLAGFDYCGSITITYSFRDGYQKENHPDPGKFYKGIYRCAYLPDNEEGRTILRMLQVAFERKLIFTIGNSRTTGHEGVITWNDIHHKTDQRPNTQFGYPDPTYLKRVKEELEVKGVTEQDRPQNPGPIIDA